MRLPPQQQYFTRIGFILGIIECTGEAELVQISYTADRMLCDIFLFRLVAEATFCVKQQFYKMSVFYIYLFFRPRNEGKYCVGRRMKFRSCNTGSCPKGKKDFREQQCSEFDGKHFNINGLTSAVRWLPKYSGSK